ncbi:hypothetical protein BGZ50_000813 [Haplosporangium sp. Z 11]|nr:hypothetical protein BGZ50_000813 [Haplosporangium sp. Z 11]
MSTTPDFHSRFSIVNHTVPASTPRFALSCNIYKRISTSLKDNNSSTPPIIFTHANGFHKEIWEPVISRLSSRWNASDMYAFDCRNQGDSAVLNKDVLEDTFDWYSYATDILKVVDTYNLKNAIGVGHSYGASAFILAEAMRPGTFSTIIAIDPTMFPKAIYTNGTLDNHPMAQLTLRRRDSWKDREDARASLLQKKFFRAWHPEAFELYLKYGMLDVVNKDGTTGITLKCPKFQEAITFAAVGGGVNDAYERLNELDIPVHIIAGANSDINVPELVEMKVDRCKYGSVDVIEDTGHLVCLENPEETANKISAFLDQFWDTRGDEQERLKARL